VAGAVGRPRRRPDMLFADRGYDHGKYRPLKLCPCADLSAPSLQGRREGARDRWRSSRRPQAGGQPVRMLTAWAYAWRS
jgi:hypothetical protein